MSDRIRRKSFYSRFNDITKKKKKPTTPPAPSPSSSLLGSPSARPRPVLDLDEALYGPTPSTPRPRRSPGVSPVATMVVIPRPKYNGALLDTALSPSAATPSSVLGGIGVMDRSPTWERSGIELRNDLMFHNYGLHRFDPHSLTVNKDALLGALSPTGSAAALSPKVEVKSDAKMAAKLDAKGETKLSTVPQPEPTPAETSCAQDADGSKTRSTDPTE